MKIPRYLKIPILLLVAALVATACTDDDETDTTTDGATEPTDGETETETDGVEQEGDSTLSTVQSRGTLNCGVNGSVPGFSFVDDEGNWSGFDVDFCKAVAAAVLGDPEAVQYTGLTAQQRFTALQTGEIDVLIRNTTWTASRDGTESSTFAHTTFYDAQGMMVRSDAGIEDLEGLDGATICTLSGTTTELNLTTAFESRGLSMTPLSFETNDEVQAAFEAGQCQGWTSDKSQLAALRSNFPEGPDALTILDVTMSKEPLGPVTRDGDSQWSQVVDWVVIATIQAEAFADEKGVDPITQANVASYETEDPDIQRFLGQLDFDAGLGLESDWAVRVIEAVGNYGEIYDRHLGPDGLDLDRGLNNMWTQGGLHYPPPYK